jgi:hypothetical protein
MFQGIMLHLVCVSSKRVENSDGFSNEPAVGRCARLLSLLGMFEFYDTVFELMTCIKVHLVLAACQIHSVLKL